MVLPAICGNPHQSSWKVSPASVSMWIRFWQKVHLPIGDFPPRQDLGFVPQRPPPWWGHTSGLARPQLCPSTPESPLSAGGWPPSKLGDFIGQIRIDLERGQSRVRGTSPQTRLLHSVLVGTGLSPISSVTTGSWCGHGD